jgi:hypothetical protein
MWKTYITELDLEFEQECLHSEVMNALDYELGFAEMWASKDNSVKL